VDSLVAPDCTVLYPYEGNLHEFMAGPGGAAVVDILLPPYDSEEERDCTFYEIHDYPHNGVAGTDDDDDAAAPSSAACWIVPTAQPEDFHCISGQYMNLAVNAKNDDMDDFMTSDSS
jgi:PCO_ADO